MVAIFAFVLACVYSMPWYVFFLGFICLILDGNVTAKRR